MVAFHYSCSSFLWGLGNFISMIVLSLLMDRQLPTGLSRISISFGGVKGGNIGMFYALVPI